MNKMSRVALLSVSVLFSAPMFAMDATAANIETAANSTANTAPAPEANNSIAPANTETQTQTPATSYFTSAKNLAMAPFVFALATAPDKIAEYSIKPVLDYIASMRYLNYACLTNNTKMISRAIVLAAAAYASYQAYVMYTAEEAVEADQDFFSEDTN